MNWYMNKLRVLPGGRVARTRESFVYAPKELRKIAQWSEIPFSEGGVEVSLASKRVP